MKRWINAATDSTRDGIKVALFDYAADLPGGDIDGIPLTEIVDRIEEIEKKTNITVDDIIDWMYDEGENLDVALTHFEDMIELLIN